MPHASLQGGYRAVLRLLSPRSALRPRSVRRSVRRLSLRGRFVKSRSVYMPVLRLSGRVRTAARSPSVRRGLGSCPVVFFACRTFINSSGVCGAGQLCCFSGGFPRLACRPIVSPCGPWRAGPAARERARESRTACIKFCPVSRAIFVGSAAQMAWRVRTERRGGY